MHDPDFAKLYAMLGLQPDCSVEQFHTAYRRAVGQRHPDRLASKGGSTTEQRLQLRELITLHAQASAFLQKHGRLPGAPRVRANVAASAQIKAPMKMETTPASEVGGWRLLVLILLGFVAWQALEQGESTVHPEPAEVGQPVPPVGDPLLLRQTHLMLGMDKETVASIQGLPDRRGISDWRYGASWLRFENGVLVDWYSAPGSRLKTLTSTPP